MKCWLHAKSQLPMDWAFGMDDFFGQAIPELRSRIKVNLRTQDIDVFEYGPGTRMKLDSTPVAGLDVRDLSTRQFHPGSDWRPLTNNE